MAERRIALGLTLGRELDATVALRWFELLRSKAWLGPVYNGRAAYTVQARNIVLEQAFAQLDEWDSLLFWDSDQLPPLLMPAFGDFAGGFVTDYLATVEEAVSGGLYYSREDAYKPEAWPHEPVAYARNPDSTYRYLTLEEMVPMLKQRGRYIVGGVGTGAMLIRQDVLIRLRDLKSPRPIFEAPVLPDGRQWTEDLFFCEEVQQLLGEVIHLDTAFESAHRADVWINSRHYLAARGINAAPSGTSKPREVYRVLLGPDGQPLN